MITKPLTDKELSALCDEDDNIAVDMVVKLGFLSQSGSRLHDYIEERIMASGMKAYLSEVVYEVGLPTEQSDENPKIILGVRATVVWTDDDEINPGDWCSHCRQFDGSDH